VDREKVIADLDQGRILLRAPFSYLLVCQRIPGACWEAARKAWTYPATRLHAATIASSIPHLQSTERFAALLVPRGKAASERKLEPRGAPKPPLALPAGLKTKPWRHQIAAYEFAMERFTSAARRACCCHGNGHGQNPDGLHDLARPPRHAGAHRGCPLRVIRVWVAQLEHHLDAHGRGGAR
jgi:hypothetical protein